MEVAENCVEFRVEQEPTLAYERIRRFVTLVELSLLYRLLWGFPQYSSENCPLGPLWYFCKLYAQNVSLRRKDFNCSRHQKQLQASLPKEVRGKS